jgi:DNA-binding beta-propeller fold protein YncE
VADGHGGDSNARVVKFSKAGKFITAWGKKGTAEGEFDTPHAIAVDSHEQVYVADRSNSRIQVFDANGKFIADWKQFGRPSGVYVDANDMIYVADSQTVDKRDARPIRVAVAASASATPKMARFEVFHSASGR